MDEINEKFAFIACSCGERFQVLGPLQPNEAGELVQEWDESATGAAYQEHRDESGH